MLILVLGDISEEVLSGDKLSVDYVKMVDLRQDFHVLHLHSFLCR